MDWSWWAAGLATAATRPHFPISIMGLHENMLYTHNETDEGKYITEFPMLQNT
jgi:hypothetical protein